MKTDTELFKTLAKYCLGGIGHPIDVAESFENDGVFPLGFANRMRKEWEKVHRQYPWVFNKILSQRLS